MSRLIGAPLRVAAIAAAFGLSGAAAAQDATVPGAAGQTAPGQGTTQPGETVPETTPSGAALPPLIVPAPSAPGVPTDEFDAARSAQVLAVQQGRTPSEEAPGGAGPLTALGAILGRGFDIEGSLRTVYDDNILRLGDGDVARDGGSKDDFRFTPTVTARIGQPFGRQQLFASALYGRDIYARNSRLDRSRILANAGVNLRVGPRCTGTVAAIYSERLNTLDEVDQVVNNVLQRQSYNANAQCSGVVGLGYGGSVDRTIQDNNLEERREFDSRETSFGARVFYTSPSFGVVSLNGSYVDVSYPNRQPFALVPIDTPPFFALSAIPDGLELWTGTLSYNRALGSRLQVAASVSYNNVTSTSSTGADVGGGYGGLGFNGSLTYRPGVRLTVVLDGGRSVTSTATVGALFVVDTRLSLNATYGIGSAWTAGLNASAAERDYRGEFATEDQPTPRDKQTTYRIGGNLTFKPSRLYDVDFELAYRTRDSEPPEFDYDSTLAAVTLRVHF